MLMNNIKYMMRTESRDEYIIEDINEVLDILERLKRNESSFITINSQPFVQNIVFIQACCNIDDKTGSAIYQIEVQTQESNGVLTQYRLEIEDLSFIEKIFMDYIKDQKITDLSEWEDVTSENPYISQANVKILNPTSSSANEKSESSEKKTGVIGCLKSLVRRLFHF